MPVLSRLLGAGRNGITPRGDPRPEARAPERPPSEDVPRTHPGSSPSRSDPRRRREDPPTTRKTLATQPVRGATARFPSEPDRPSPQSQSFSRSYGSGLPTSLTYINLSARGCSPRRPDADMGTNRCEGTHSRPRVFKALTGGARTPQEPRRSSGPRPSLWTSQFTRPSAP